MAIEKELAVLTAADGFTLEAFVASPAGASKAGLILLQEIFGLTDQLKGVARRYAEAGYETVVPVLFDRIAPCCVMPFEEIERARSLIPRLDQEAVMRDIAAARDHFDRTKSVSVLGFRRGGGLALAAAGRLRLTCAISCYGTRLSDHLASPPGRPMLFHFGESDLHSPPEVIEAVRAAVSDAEIHLYGAGHAFANDARSAYRPDAALSAEARSLAIL